jgi:hypothetical protein
MQFAKLVELNRLMKWWKLTDAVTCAYFAIQVKTHKIKQKWLKPYRLNNLLLLDLSNA